MIQSRDSAMTLPFNLETLTPTENNWFSTTVEYSGPARAEFTDPAGVATGRATVRFDESGRIHSTFEIDEIVCDRHLTFGEMQFFSGDRPKESGNGCSSLGLGTP